MTTQGVAGYCPKGHALHIGSTCQGAAVAAGGSENAAIDVDASRGGRQRIVVLVDASSSSMLLSGTMPHKLFGRPQLLRLTIPVVTSPDVRPNGSQTGLGDLNIFDTFLFKNNLQLQPLVIRNFPKGWYARSTALWTWDLEQDTYYIPLGLGVWKVWAGASKKTVNVFAEPQWTVAHKGDGVPKFQLFAGLNLQFSLVR